MNYSIANIRLSIIVAALLVLPLLTLEFINMDKIGVSFPFMLFAFLWTLAAVGIFLILLLVRDIRAGKGLTAAPVSSIFRVAVVLVIAVVWSGLVNDQMPCFWGVPNCD